MIALLGTLLVVTAIALLAIAAFVFGIVCIADALLRPGSERAAWLSDPPMELLPGTNDLALLAPLGYRDRHGVESWLTPPFRWDGASFTAWMLSFLGMKVDRRHRRFSAKHDDGCRRRVQPAWTVHRDLYDGAIADGVNPRKAALCWLVVFCWRPTWRVS